MELRGACQTGYGRNLSGVPEGKNSAAAVGATPAEPAEDPIDELAVRRRYEDVIAAHLPSLRAAARRLCRSHHDPDDVVQAALLRAFRTKSQVSDPMRMRAWLITVVTNTFFDLTRKQRRQPPHVPFVDDVSILDPVDSAPWDHLGLDDVRRAIDQLPDDVRETYRMFALEGLDYISIAKAQEIPKATVGSRIFRARKQLRVRLTEKSPMEKPRGKAPL